MSATAAISRSWVVGAHRVTLTVPANPIASVSACLIEWEPDIPQRLTAEEWGQYQTGRDQAIAELSAVLGIRVAVIDL